MLFNVRVGCACVAAQETREMGTLCFLVSLCVLSFIHAVTSTSNAIPELPGAFSVMVEENYLAGEPPVVANSTVYSFGYYDYTNDRFRIEEHTILCNRLYCFTLTG
jgi:hypothetical protein